MKDPKQNPQIPLITQKSLTRNAAVSVKEPAPAFRWKLARAFIVGSKSVKSA
jgi:hypothetical protein